MESLSTFVKRFCSSVGCYSHANRSANQYSLKKYDTHERLRMGVFGWVRELKQKGIFEVSLYKDLGDQAGVSRLADLVKPRWIWKKEGIIFYVKPDSKGNDYQNAVRASKATLSLKS